MTRCRCTFSLLLALLCAGCAPRPSSAPPAAPATGPAAAPSAAPASKVLRFWHTQTQDNEKALKQIVDDFNAQAGHPFQVEANYIGSYEQLYEKLKAAAAAHDPTVLPDLAVAYESMIADYMAAKIVRPLDDLLKDPQIGLDEASVKDIFPAYLATNRFAQFGGQLLSFPFTKSNLMLYCNTSLLEEAGAKVPKTWPELIDACRAIKKKHPDVAPFSVFSDASAMDGLVLSCGGKLLLPDGTSGFGGPETEAALGVYATLFKEKLAAEATEKGTQNNDFSNSKCAFFLRSSTARSDIAKLVGDKFKWDLAGLPSKPGVSPVTVLFGGNICILKSAPERERAAWEFIKYFTSTDVTAKWAIASGYLPVRKSAVEAQATRDAIAAQPQYSRALDVLPIAVAEPNVAGWQDVRKALDDAQAKVINGLESPAQIAGELKAAADAALAQAKK
jgi:ABC-type glycerol-3-phosphate transport system substrate-binding protein